MTRFVLTHFFAEFKQSFLIAWQEVTKVRKYDTDFYVQVQFGYLAGERAFNKLSRIAVTGNGAGGKRSLLVAVLLLCDKLVVGDGLVAGLLNFVACVFDVKAQFCQDRGLKQGNSGKANEIRGDALKFHLLARSIQGGFAQAITAKSEYATVG